METALSKTSDGQERLGRAKDRLDVRVAEIGQAEIDKETEDNVEPVTETAAKEQKTEDEEDVAELFQTIDGDFDDAPELQRGTQRYDMSPRASMAKRRSDNDDMDDDATDKRLRPRSPTVSYRSDQDSGFMDDGNLNGLDEIDRKILSAAILNVDITEVYSPERVARIAKKFGMVAGSSMDLTNGWDFNREDHKRQAWSKIRDEAPYLLIGSPPCTYFSVLQELNKAVHGDKPGWQARFDAEKDKAIKHVEFCCALYKHQIKQGRHFLHEHPWTARSWRLPCVDELLKHPSVAIAQGHMYQFRMTSHIDRRGGEVGLVKKPTGFMTSSQFLLRELDKKCPGGHQHVPLVGGRAAAAQVYPDMLCEAICRGVVRQKKHDQSGLVTTGKLSYLGLKSFCEARVRSAGFQQ